MYAADLAGDEILTIRNKMDQIDQGLSTAVIGQPDLNKGYQLSLMTGEPMLTYGNPGNGKTHMCMAGAALIGGSYRFMQGTPDTMPSSITGWWEYVRRQDEWQFREGIVHANVALLDEFNRMPPRVQAVLYEAMQFRQTTVEGDTRKLPDPNVIMGAMNPEGEGTYPMTEAGLDRWGIGVEVGRVGVNEEIRISRGEYVQPEELKPIQNGLEFIREVRRLVRDLVKVMPEEVAAFNVNLVRKTMDPERFSREASIRASIVMNRLVVANALMHGSIKPTIDDSRAVARFALGHKIILSDKLQYAGTTSRDVLAELIAGG